MATAVLRGWMKQRMYVWNGSAWVAFSGAGAGGTSSAFSAAFPGSGTALGFLDSTATNMVPGNLDASGNLKVAGSFSSAPVKSATATLSVAAVDGANHTAVALNVPRQGLRLVNLSAARVAYKYGAVASFTSLTGVLLPGQELAQPWDGYNGRVDIISEAADATAGAGVYVTELTA